MYTLLSFFKLSDIGRVLSALLILMLSFILATIAKKLTCRILNKLKFFKRLDENNKEKQSLINLGSNLVFLLVFLLFVQEILKILGVEILTTQFYNFFNRIWSYLPNILASIIILIIGISVAKIIRQIVFPIFESIKINKFQELSGFEVIDKRNLSDFLSYLIYVLIIIPVVITSLSVLDIKIISTPAISVFTRILNFIPNILLSVVILISGFFIAKIISGIILKLIEALNIDTKLDNLLPTNTIFKKLSFSNLITAFIKTVIYILFIAEALDTLHLSILSNIGVLILNYIPKLLTAITLIVIAIFLVELIEKFLSSKVTKFVINLIKFTIYTVISFMILNHLGIAIEIINSAFIIILASLGIAFSLAFGIAGRDFAANVLKNFEKNINKK